MPRFHHQVNIASDSLLNVPLAIFISFHRELVRVLLSPPRHVAVQKRTHRVFLLINFPVITRSHNHNPNHNHDIRPAFGPVDRTYKRLLLITTTASSQQH